MMEIKEWLHLLSNDADQSYVKKRAFKFLLGA